MAANPAAAGTHIGGGLHKRAIDPGRQHVPLHPCAYNTLPTPLLYIPLHTCLFSFLNQAASRQTAAIMCCFRVVQQQSKMALVGPLEASRPRTTTKTQLLLLLNKAVALAGIKGQNRSRDPARGQHQDKPRLPTQLLEAAHNSVAFHSGHINTQPAHRAKTTINTAQHSMACQHKQQQQQSCGAAGCDACMRARQCMCAGPPGRQEPAGVCRLELRLSNTPKQRGEDSSSHMPQAPACRWSACKPSTSSSKQFTCWLSGQQSGQLPPARC